MVQLKAWSKLGLMAAVAVAGIGRREQNRGNSSPGAQEGGGGEVRLLRRGFSENTLNMEGSWTGSVK